MNKNTGIIIGIIVIIVAGIVFTSKEKKAVAPVVENEAVVVENANAGTYEVYAPEKLARAESGDVVLFFHAAWCPSCRLLNADIEKNLGAIPQGISILKLDYDTEIDLKKKYGVTYQHTLVQVDKDGNMIKKWSGSPSLSSLVTQVN